MPASDAFNQLGRNFAFVMDADQPFDPVMDGWRSVRARLARIAPLIYTFSLP
jgi:hypothetical protein